MGAFSQTPPAPATRPSFRPAPTIRRWPAPTPSWSASWRPPPAVTPATSLPAFAGGRAKSTSSTAAIPVIPLSTDTINIPIHRHDPAAGGQLHQQRKLWGNRQRDDRLQGSRLVLASKTSGADGNLTVSSAATNFTSTGGSGCAIDGGRRAGRQRQQHRDRSDSRRDPQPGRGRPEHPGADQRAARYHPGGARRSRVSLPPTTPSIGSINSQYTVDSSGNEGVSGGRQHVADPAEQLLRHGVHIRQRRGQYVNLQSMGIEMQNDGTLQINSVGLEHGPEQQLFRRAEFLPVDFAGGLGTERVGTQMLQLTDPTLGPVAADINGLNQTNKSLTNQITDFEARMTTVQAAVDHRNTTTSTRCWSNIPCRCSRSRRSWAACPARTSSSSSSS